MKLIQVDIKKDSSKHFDFDKENFTYENIDLRNVYDVSILFKIHNDE